MGSILTHFRHWYCGSNPLMKQENENLRVDIVAPTEAKTKKNVEMNSARHDLRAVGVTVCSKRDFKDAIFIEKLLSFAKDGSN